MKEENIENNLVLCIERGKIFAIKLKTKIYYHDKTECLSISTILLEKVDLDAISEAVSPLIRLL